MRVAFSLTHLSPVARLRRLGNVEIQAIEGPVVWATTERRNNFRICLETGVVLAKSREVEELVGTRRVMRTSGFSDLPSWPEGEFKALSVLVALLESELNDKEFIQSLRIDGFDVSETTVVRNFRGFYSVMHKAEKVCPTYLIRMALTPEVNAKEAASN